MSRSFRIMKMNCLVYFFVMGSVRRAFIICLNSGTRGSGRNLARAAALALGPFLHKLRRLLVCISLGGGFIPVMHF